MTELKGRMAADRMPLRIYAFVSTVLCPPLDAN